MVTYEARAIHGVPKILQATNGLKFTVTVLVPFEASLYLANAPLENKNSVNFLRRY